MIFAILTMAFNVFAQESIVPASFKYNNLSLNVPQVELQKLDNQQLMAADVAKGKDGSPLQIGVMQNVYLVMDKCGRVDLLPDGGKLWRLNLKSEGAVSVDLHLANVEIPDGAAFYLYDPYREDVVEEITNAELLNQTDYYTDNVPGDELILEYYEPVDAAFAGTFEIAQLGHVYRASRLDKGYHGDSEGDCHIDVICPEGDDWRDQIRSVVLYKIFATDGIYMCSGAMVNNARKDGTPYVLTAKHCEKPNATYRYYFKYEATDCGGTGSVGISVFGGVRRAYSNTSGNSDFMLMEITGNISHLITSDMYLAGWDASGSTPGIGACIHHPGGDLKKISIPQTISSRSYYWRTVWYSKGVTEQGSSGSPLFDANKRIVGQLFGGSSFCETPQAPDDYGKLSHSWTNNNTSNNSLKLQPWLDPDNTGRKTLNGSYFYNVGVKENQPATNSFTIYPNPSNGRLQINAKGMEGDAKCSVYDLVGKMVYSTSVIVEEGISLDLSFLDNGVYILELNTGKSVQTSKLIISK